MKPLGIAQAAKRLGISYGWLWRILDNAQRPPQQRDLPDATIYSYPVRKFYPVGTRLKIDPNDLESFIEARKGTQCFT